MANIVNNEVFDVLSVLGYGPISSGILYSIRQRLLGPGGSN